MEKQSLGVGIIGTLIRAGHDSMATMRGRISCVRLADSSVAVAAGVEVIEFEVDGQRYRGHLRGRNRDCVVGHSPEANKSLALSVLLDGHAELVN